MISRSTDYFITVAPRYNKVARYRKNVRYSGDICLVPCFASLLSPSRDPSRARPQFLARYSEDPVITKYLVK